MHNHELLNAAALVVGFGLAMSKGAKLVEQITGREPRQRSSAYEGLYFLLALGIGMPPIYLFPDTHWLAFTAFIFLGILIGSLTAQAALGVKRNRDETGTSV